MCTGKKSRDRGRNRERYLSSQDRKTSKAAVIIVSCAIIILLLVSFAYAVTTLLAESVSRSSTFDSRNPSIAIGENDVNMIHYVWEDDTELNETEGGVPIGNSPDKDIFYIYRNRTEFSHLHAEGGKLVGGVNVVSNNSLTSSKNQDIAVDYNNTVHVVWEGIIKPSELTADVNTTFLHHFDNASSGDADYALGQASPLVNTGPTSSPNSVYNRSMFIKSSDKLVYNATSNFALLNGTIEFWYNPQHFSRSLAAYDLFGAWNSPNASILMEYYDVETGYFTVQIKYNTSYTFEMRYYPHYEIKKNEWHHIAFSYDFTGGKCRLYVDGYIGAENTSCQGTGFTISNFSIGMDMGRFTSTSLSQRLEGMADEFRLSNAVRSPEEVRQDAGQRDIFYRSLNGTKWSETDVITSDDDNNSYFPRIDVDKNNTLHVTWNSYHNSSFSTVHYKQKDETGTWTSAEVVSTGTESYFPDIAVDQNNNSLVVWQDVDTNGNFTGFSTIMYRKRNYTDWADIENVSNRTYDIFGVNASRYASSYVFAAPRIAVGQENTTHITWSTQSGFPDQDLLFYISFDDMSANATFANASNAAINNESYPGMPGKPDEEDIINTGYSALVNGTGYINYSAANNMNPDYGTIMMWVKPGFDPGAVVAGRINNIFTYYSSNASQSDIDEYISFYVEQCDGTAKCDDVNSALLTFHIRDNKTTDNLALNNITDWNSNEWHHIAATWNLSAGTNATKMYIDGVLAELILFPDNTTPIYFNDTPTEIIVGNVFNESTADYPYVFNGSIDEVMVFGRILNENEIDAARKRDMDIVYRQKNDSGWQDIEFVSTSSNYMSILPAITAKDSSAYIIWPFSVSSYDYLSTDYVYGSFYKIAVNTRNSTSWDGLEQINDESIKEAFAPDVVAVRPGKIDVVWEDKTSFGGTDIDIFYRESENSTSPSAQMIFPTGGEILNADFNVNATASDVDSTIANVSFYYTIDDGVSGNFICTAASSPYSCTWIIGAAAEDIYKIKAIATSDDGGRNWSISDFMYLDSSTAVKTYTYNETGNQIGTNRIYEKAYTNATASRPDPDNSSTLGTDITNATIRANFSSPDNQRHKTAIGLGCGNYNYTNANVYKFYINDTATNISNIRIQWQGYGYDANGYLTNLSIWNFDTSSWKPLAYRDFIESEDDDLSYSILSGFSSYLDPANNSLYLLVETEDYANSFCGFGVFACPVYLSWNGTEYRFETEGILGIFDRRLEIPTYDRLEHAKPHNGTIKVAIAEIAEETTYMDSAELIAVDHSKDVDILLDFNGVPRTVRNPRNVICRDRFGDDCTKLVEAEDEKPQGAASSLKQGLVGSRSLHDPVLFNGPEGNYWVSNLAKLDLNAGSRDYIEITLPDADKINPNIVKLILSGSDTGFLSDSEANLFNLAGETLPYLYNILDNTPIGKLGGEGIFRTAPIRIQVLDENNRWVDYPETFRNALLGSYRTLVFPLNASYIRGNKLRINMLAYAYAIDYIAADYSDDKDVIIGRSKADINSLSDSDDDRAVFRTGDFVEISFDDPIHNEGNPPFKRTYFLKTEGYYHPGETESRNSMGIEEINPLDIGGVISALKRVKNGLTYARMIYDPSFAERYMLDYYLKAKSRTKGMPGKESGFGLKKTQANSLYTDFVRVTVAGCVVPVDNLEIFSNVTFCNGYFNVPDADGDGAVIKILGDNLTLDCNRATLDSGGNSNPFANSDKGVAIGLNHTKNVIIRNCNITRYNIGIGMNRSTGIKVYNNTLKENYIGIGGEATNNSVVYDNVVQDTFYVGYSLIGNSMNNTIKNNTAINISLLGLALDDSDNNTIEFNTINGTANISVLYGLAGISVMRGADRNTIKNNTLFNLELGIGMADVGAFFGEESYGPSGQQNNFTSNIMDRMLIAGIGLLYPYDDDYNNYFDQNNMVNGEKVYYYYDVHGNETSYKQVNGLNLTAGNTSLFTGKITFANTSYINITDNNVSGNFYGIFIINSNHILASNNRATNNQDTSLGFADTQYTVGTGFLVINSDSINLTGNNASLNRIGFFTKNSGNLSLINNTAWSNTQLGFFINLTNESTMMNNTAKYNAVAGYTVEYSWNNLIANNTAINNTLIGLYLGNNFNNTVERNIIFNNSYGAVLNSTNETFSNNTAMNNTFAGVVYIECIDGITINESDNIVENNTGAGYIFWMCNSTRVFNLNTTQNSRAGFELISSHFMTLFNLKAKDNFRGFYFNDSDNNTLAHSYSVNNTLDELFFSSSTDNYIVNSVIINNVSGPDVNSTSNSWNYGLNMSLNESNFDNDSNSNFSIQWYLDLYILDNESIPVSGANITINDTMGNNFSDNSDANARARFNLTEYTIKGAAYVYFSNYTWNITKLGYMSNVSIVNMSQNQEINVTINLLGGISDTSPPTNPSVFDGYDYADVDWINNKTTLYASWVNSTDRHLIFYAYRILENGTCLAGSCASTDVGQDTRIMISGLALQEGYNYTIGIRARDSLYYYTPFSYSDGAITDFTAPTVTVNSSTHQNSSQWYSSPNVTFFFYGNDSLSGIAGFSYLLDQNSGTGPDFIEEARENIKLQDIVNSGYGATLRANGTGSAFAVFSEVNGNLTSGDNLTVKVALREDVSDTLDDMSIKAYILSKDILITNYDLESLAISNIDVKTLDLNTRDFANADIHAFNLTATSAVTGSFYVVVAADVLDDNNTHNISIAGKNTDVDNTTESYICEEGGSCTNTTLTADYAIEVLKQDSRTIWYKTYSNLANGDYWLHVRARDVAGNWGEPSHFRARIDAVNGTPIFTLSKPNGYIITANPVLAAETNEFTTCQYNTTNTSYTAMTSYDGLHHEAKLTDLAEATYTYSFNCTDRAGNSAYNDTTFIVSLSAAPDTVSIFPLDNVTVGQEVRVDINVTKDFNGAPFGLGELTSFSANLTNSSATYRISSSVKDRGSGIYTLTFTAPLTAGDYTLTVSVNNVSDTEAFTVSSFTLTIKYASSEITHFNAKSNIAYSQIGNAYIIGLAGDASGTTTTGTSSSLLQVKGSAINDNLFIFITRSVAEPASVSKYLDTAAFLDLENPSFGFNTEQEEHVLSAMLEYGDVSIIGSNEVQEGRYTLLIKNEGINQTTGKTKVSIKII